MLRLSHELRTPLSVLTGSVEIIAEEKGISKKERIKLKEATTNVLGILSNIITFTRENESFSSYKRLEEVKKQIFDGNKRLFHVKTKNKGVAGIFQILVVDDNEDLRFLLKKFITQLYPEVKIDFACNGKEGLMLYKKDPQNYDIILMDLRMPIMNGFEATKIIRSFEKNKKIHKTPIIAITAHDLEFEKEKAMKLGFDYYLTKPFSKQDLFNAVQKFKT